MQISRLPWAFSLGFGSFEFLFRSLHHNSEKEFGWGRLTTKIKSYNGAQGEGFWLPRPANSSQNKRKAQVTHDALVAREKCIAKH
jgi:hypothetical protein